jgi:starvation-inducible DNA-binding protein
MLDTTHLSTASPTTAAISAHFLTPVVRSCQWLSIKVKQAQRNLQGLNFISVHELLDAVATHARDGADEAAERIVTG